MSSDKDGEGQGEAPAKPRRTRSGTSRNKRAADASKEGMGEVLPLHPNRAAGLQAGVEAQVERGKIPRDPDYVSRAKLFQQGLLLPEDMDMEELERLQFRDRHGNMAGRPPKLSAAQQRAIHAEWLRRIGKMYEGGLEFAIRALIKIIQDPRTKDADRLKAIDMLAARAIGREPQTVNVNASSAWPDALEAGIIVELNREDVG